MAAHPFYEQLNRILDRHGFDDYVEGLSAEFYHERMRRTHLRGHANIFKRLLIHVAGFNLR